jgi:hypothetical protein
MEDTTNWQRYKCLEHQWRRNNLRWWNKRIVVQTKEKTYQLSKKQMETKTHAFIYLLQWGKYVVVFYSRDLTPVRKGAEAADKNSFRYNAEVNRPL